MDKLDMIFVKQKALDELIALNHPEQAEKMWKIGNGRWVKLPAGKIMPGKLIPAKPISIIVKSVVPNRRLYNDLPKMQ